MCIWSCSEESQLRVSMNLDRGKTVWVLGVFFFSPFLSVFFFIFIFIFYFLLLFLGERAGGCSIRPVFYFVDKPVFHFVFPG